MKLIRARVQNYRSAEVDYPRRFATRFDERHPGGSAEVTRTWWKLADADLAAVEKDFGPGALKSDEFQVHYGFRYEDDHRVWDIKVDNAKCLENLVDKHALNAAERNVLHGVSDGPDAEKALSGLAERTAKQEALLQEIKQIRKSRFSLGVIDLLESRQPRLFFTSHFERMSGMVSLNELQQDRQNNAVSVGDKIFLSFLEYAGTRTRLPPMQHGVLRPLPQRPPTGVDRNRAVGMPR